MKKYIIIAITLFCTATQTRALNDPATPANNDVQNRNIHNPASSVSNPSVTALKNEDVQVYANPSCSKLILKTGAINKATINVINTYGKAVAQLDTQSNETSLNVSAFPNGNYLLEIWTRDGNMISKSFTIAR